MIVTSRYGLPLLQAGQAQKEITHNEALARIDVLAQLAVDSRACATVPTADGTWIVPSNATGAWAGHDGQIAVLDDTGWTFVAPRDGCLAFVLDETLFTYYRDGAWRDAWPVASLAFAKATGTALTAPTSGATVDAELRTAFGQLLGVLRRVGIVAA